MKQIRDYAFVSRIEELGGSVYSVGGAVRDKIIGRKSKDLDLLITGIPLEQLAQELSAFGKVKEVGQAFGIILMVINGEEIEVAIPRTERKIGEGHKGFEVNTDHMLPIEYDLYRRDFCCNAMAMDAEGNLIDPYGGLEDIKNKTLRAVNPKAFEEDPLRMLRAIQFAVRLNFWIEPDTYQMIRKNAYRITEISGERILMEFEKIVKAGPDACLMADTILGGTHLHRHIFGVLRYTAIIRPVMGKFEPKTMAEFIYLLCMGSTLSPSEFYRKRLKGDTPTYNLIQALEIAIEPTDDYFVARLNAHSAYLRSTDIIESEVIDKGVKHALSRFADDSLPATVKHLAINGDDLIKLGYEGQAIGKAQSAILYYIYKSVLKNNKEDIMEFITNENFKVRKEVKT